MADRNAQALVVGITSYRHVGDLPGYRDADGIYDVLTSDDYCGYPPERVTRLIDDDATRDRILAGLDALAAQSTAETRTFVYFAGHGGQAADKASYLLPVDARKGEYPTTAIAGRELAQRLARCQGQVTVVLDCCYAAGLAAGDDLALAGFGDRLRAELQAPQRVVFAASSADALAYGSLDAPYGLFTGHLLDGLCGKASTDGNDVNVLQLFDYVQRNVTATRGAQHPTLIAHLEQLYTLTRYPRPVAPSPVFERDVFFSYDRGDAVVGRWLERDLYPALVDQGVTIWTEDGLGELALDQVDRAIRTSKYTAVILTRGYLRDRMEELNASMAILQAVHTRTPRFIPIRRDRFAFGELPLAFEAFVGLDLSPANHMGQLKARTALIARLKKPPHQR